MSLYSPFRNNYDDLEEGIILAKKTKQVEFTPEQNQKLNEWYTVQQQLSKVKEEELALRVWCVQNLGFDPKKLEGSETIEFANGWELQAKKVQNYSVANDEGQAMAVLNLLGSATGANRPDLAQNLVKWNPELSTKVYKEVLPIIEQVPGLKEAMSKAITIKIGTPQLELKPPKPTEAEIEIRK
jgi:hypothetical protein